jgi:flavin reductase (DIM6/NTAB) family NADH-FMN oxidoreductase RutF
MEKAPVRPLSNAYRLVNPGCVVLISVGDGKRDNLFPVAWNTPVRKDPGMLAIVSGKGHFSFPFIERTGELGVNVPDVSIADALLGCGRTSGREVADKFGRFQLSRQASSRIRAPLVGEAVANLECRVCQVVDLGASALILAQILEAVASTEHFQDGHWVFGNGLRLLHHLSGERFTASEAELIASRPQVLDQSSHP